MSRPTPFDDGAASISAGDEAPNPFDEGSVEFNNFELGRAYALRGKDAVTQFAPDRPKPTKDKVGKVSQR